MANGFNTNTESKRQEAARWRREDGELALTGLLAALTLLAKSVKS